MRVLFRAAAGPTLGFGHLVRCRSIARALGVIPTVSIRGSRETQITASARGFEVRNGGTALLRGPSRPDVLVIDDPSADQAARWVRRARQAGVPVATLHDVGLAYTPSDLAIDGSIAPRTDAPTLTLAGPTYAALDPSIATARCESPGQRNDVLIALGGGSHVTRWGHAIAAGILARRPDTRVRIAAGFTSTPASADPRVTWVSAPYGLVDELRQAQVAVVGGGMTLYEAAALGAPTVAVALVPAQRPTIQGFARRRAAVDGGTLTDAASVARVADEVTALLASPARTRKLGQAGVRLVDGRGVFRVADAVRRLTRRARERTHAA